MYQLSHLLIEQSNILASLREQNSVGDGKGLLNDGADGRKFIAMQNQLTFLLLVRLP